MADNISENAINESIAEETVKLPSPTIMCLTKKTHIVGDFFVLEGHCLTKLVRSDKELDLSRVYVWIEQDGFKSRVEFKSPTGTPFIKGWRKNYFIIKIPMEGVLEFSGRRRLSLLYDDGTEEFVGRLLYRATDYRRGKGRRSKPKYCWDRAIFLRQSKKNTVYIVASKVNIPIVINLTKRVTREGDDIVVRAKCLTKLLFDNGKTINTDLISMRYASEHPADMKFGSVHGFPFIKGYRINSYEFKVPLSGIADLDIQNKIKLKYNEDSNGRIIYTVWDYLKGKNRNTEVFSENGLSVYFRQTVKNTMYLTVREENYFDHPEGRALVEKAYKEAKRLGPGDFILMYEKECEKYEESASVLYEKLIDLGYTNVYYVLNKDNKALATMPDKYKANIIEKHSYDHIVKFFRCHKFVGTETIGHAIQLRAANKKIVDKVNSKDVSYVFLQHGVMYMISLDADLRSGFRQTGLNLYRVVASSRLEAEHFTELGGFEEEEVYVTGLAKFDRSYRYEDADKIVIMPTWRRWEANEARENFAETAYYKMIDRIVSVIPAEYRDKIIILPHPLMQKAMESNDIPLGKYVHPDKTHDETLRECRLLITDYSSIAYDAFYRGSNVIFYWEEKDECLDHYGGAHLMINEDNVFGDVCYNKYELSRVIEQNYQNPQTREQISKFREIVEFHDNKNAERIVEKLRTDGIIE